MMTARRFKIHFTLMAIILLCAANLTALSALAQATNPDALKDPQQEALARDIMKEIRCLQCQNQSIEDSNADLAKDLRKLVRLKVSEGMTRAQVKDYLVVRYGDWVLLKPPVKSSTYILWGSPIIFLLLMVFFILRRKSDATGRPNAAPLSAQEEQKLADLLAETQDQLRAEDNDPHNTQEGK